MSQVDFFNSIAEKWDSTIKVDEKRINKDNFITVVEISKNGRNKYELDKQTGMLKLDRVLYTSTHYPANYGFIPKTYADDNDPLDVLILCQEEIVPLTLVECYPIGVLIMTDNNEQDEKIIAICKQDPFLNCYKDIKEAIIIYVILMILLLFVILKTNILYEHKGKNKKGK